MVCKCCVLNCPFKNSKPKLRRFPVDRQLFLIWLNAINRTDLYEKDPKTVRENYRVCDHHFTSDSKFKATKQNLTDLKRNAVPSLLINLENCPPEEHLEPNEDCDKSLAVPGTSKIARDPLAELSQNAVPEAVDFVEAQEVPLKELPHNLDRETKNVSRKKRPRRQPTQTKVTEQSLFQKKHILKAVANIKNLSDDLRDQEDLNNKEYLDKIIEFVGSEKYIKAKLNTTTYKFVMSQLKQQCKKSKGRRYTDEDKIFAMALLKQSPKEFQLLRKVFALPSRKTITRVLKGCDFSSGINTQVIQTLKKEIEKMNTLDKHCILVFDEISLEAGLTFNKEEDLIYGVEEIPERRGSFADHAMVFLVRGIARKWKQPISYYFARGAMKSTTVGVEIKKTIAALQDIGLFIVATCCDQYNSATINFLRNQSRIEYLKLNQQEEYKSPGFYINGQEIVPLYDVPHLLKGLRNNLLNKNLKFKWRKDTTQLVSWVDIIQFYEVDAGDFDTKMCNKLTDEHIYPDKMKKMKVKHAAQVFSQRVSASMKALLKFGGDTLPASAEGTADFLLFVDKLFDSLNGSILKPEFTKPLRCAIQKHSAHHKFFPEARKVLKSIEYFDLNGMKTRIPPTIPNLIKTIEGVEHIWKKLEQIGFKFLFPRRLNQDVLENTFSIIRSHGCRNINPTCVSFKSSFKTLLINNYFSAHSPSANCEPDDCSLGITGMQNFLKEIPSSPVLNEEDFDPLQIRDLNNLISTFKYSPPNLIIKNQHAFIAGYVAKQILKRVGKCDDCRKCLLSNTNEQFHSLINFRSRGTQALLKPNSYFVYLFTLCVNLCHHFLPKLFYLRNIKKILTYICKKFIIEIFSCKKHELLNIYLDIFLKFYIFTWVKNVNRTLRGINTTQINDEVKEAAKDYYLTHKARKGSIQRIKKIALSKNELQLAIL